MPFTTAQKQQAIQYLLVHTPKSTLQEVYELKQGEGTGWPSQQHFGLGIWVRNALREGGFAWDDQTLDNEWAELIAEAAERSVNSE